MSSSACASTASGTFKSERPRGLPIEDEFKLGRSHYRQRGRCLSLEDTTGIDADLAVSFRGARSVTHQAADLDALTEGVNRRQPLMRGQRDELYATGSLTMDQD